MTNEKREYLKNVTTRRLMWIRRQVHEGNYFTALTSFDLIHDDLKLLHEDQFNAPYPETNK